MKTRVLPVLGVLLFGAAAILPSAGCAGTKLSRSTGEYVDDAALTTKVKAELLRDPIVSGMQVGVDTFKGVVQLNGFVDTAQEKSRAEQIARNVPGVANVQNRLTVKTQAQPNATR